MELSPPGREFGETFVTVFKGFVCRANFWRGSYFHALARIGETAACGKQLVTFGRGIANLIGGDIHVFNLFLEEQRG